VRLATDRTLRKTLAENARAAAGKLSWRTEKTVLAEFVARRVEAAARWGRAG
jgi:hypothetical protein